MFLFIFMLMFILMLILVLMQFWAVLPVGGSYVSAPLRVLESRTQPPYYISCYVYVMLILMFMICSVHVYAVAPFFGPTNFNNTVAQTTF